jgi:acetyl-CoA acetyltransferase
MKIRRYMTLHGISPRTLGLAAAKAFRNGALTPHAWRREAIDLDTILAAPMVADPLTKYMFCSPSEGGAALVLASAKTARALARDQVHIVSAAVRTRVTGSFEVFSPMLDIARGPAPTVLAARAAFEQAGLGPADMALAQLQDAEAGGEIIHLAENGFCADGEQERLYGEGTFEPGGTLPVNTDGGCLANGEPIGASGLRQVYENVMQLRSQAGARQVPGDPKLAYSQVYGSPGLSAVVIVGR